METITTPYTVTPETSAVIDALRAFRGFEDAYMEALRAVYGDTSAPAAFERSARDLQPVREEITKLLQTSVSEALDASPVTI